MTEAQPTGAFRLPCIVYLQDRFAATVESRSIREEDVRFPLPRELRQLTSAV